MMLKLAVTWGVRFALVALVAFCMWLTVRIINRRERWATRLAVWLSVAIVAYPMSTGPTAWATVHGLPSITRRILNDFYTPLLIAKLKSPEWSKELLDWYVDCWADRDELAKAMTR